MQRIRHTAAPAQPHTALLLRHHVHIKSRRKKFISMKIYFFSEIYLFIYLFIPLNVNLGKHLILTALMQGVVNA